MLLEGDGLALSAVVRRNAGEDVYLGLLNATASSGYYLAWQTDNNAVVYRCTAPGSGTALLSSGGTTQANEAYETFQLRITVSSLYHNRVTTLLPNRWSSGVAADNLVTLTSGLWYPAVLSPNPSDTKSFVYYRGPLIGM
jgi:hypothetical protein